MYKIETYDASKKNMTSEKDGSHDLINKQINGIHQNKQTSGDPKRV